MRRTVARSIQALLIATAAFGVLAYLSPGRVEILVRIYLLVALAILLFLAVSGVARSVPRPGPSAFDAGLRRQRPRRERPSDLVRTETRVQLATSDAFDLHYRLRPMLVEVARGLLVTRRGVSLEHDPERARSLLGEDCWQLVQPARPAPMDRSEPGVPPSQLARALDGLERLA